MWYNSNPHHNITFSYIKMKLREKRIKKEKRKEILICTVQNSEKQAEV